MITHNFGNLNEVTEKEVKVILDKEPKIKKIKEETDGKFDGSGDGKEFDCYFSINGYTVDIYNPGGNINARIMTPQPNTESLNFKIASEFATKAKRIIN